MYLTDRNKKIAASIKRLEELEKKQKELILNYNSLLGVIEEREKKLYQC